MPIVLDHSHSDEVVLVLWRIDDCTTAIGMIADLVKADSCITDTADSVLCRSYVGQQTCIAEDANVRIVVNGAVVETVGSRSLALDTGSEGHNHGVRSRLGWSAEWLVSFWNGEYRWCVLLLTILVHVLGRRAIVRPMSVD